MHTNLLLLASLTTVSVAGVPNTFKISDPAKAELVNANFKYLDSAVGTKADTAALSALKASIPASVNIGGKVDTAALTTRLNGYAAAGTVAAALGAKADTTALNAVKASIPVGVNIGGKVDTAALTVRLAGYAPAGALANFATTSSLAAYATSAALTN
ncbi:MAG: hypothetical protein IPN71_01185 [Fibrobacteres bacterium]|nr:hypothetical protein [Fibrobacterota bacterium]